MKSCGILDEIEKLVEDAWEVEEKGINTHIDQYQKENTAYEMFMQEEMHRRSSRYRDKYMQEIDRRIRWDSPMPYSRLDVSRPDTIVHKCKCGKNIKVSYLKEDMSYRAFSSAFINYEDLKFDTFHCPRCGERINVVGKILEISIDMTE